MCWSRNSLEFKNYRFGGFDMKKIILSMAIIFVCLLVTGCGNKVKIEASSDELIGTND